MDNTNLTNCCIDEYEWREWKAQLGSIPVERLEHEDVSQSYEMDRASAYRLENGQYALITESGCSCYTASWANVNLYPSAEAVRKAFADWKKDRSWKGAN